jgi:glycosyltransferase involved in cell wall biosynthesis
VTETAGALEDGVVPSTRAGSLRILFICHSRALGGAEAYLEQIATRAARVADVQVVCRPDPVLDEWVERLTAAGVRFVRLRLGGVADFRRLRRAVRWASVVHLNLADRVGSYQVVATLACRLERRPLACTYHLARETEDLPMGWFGRRFRTLALGAVYGYARRNIALSEEGSRLLPRRAGLDPRRVVQIANGVDADRFTPVPDAGDRRELRRRLLGPDAPDGVLCCTVARLTAQKGLDVLVEAAAILRGRHGGAPARFVVVGDGELHGALQARIDELGVADTVELAGARPPEEIPSWLAASDVFVLSSHYEGMSLAAMEAMASGLPLVVTRVSGTAELVPSPDDGRVVRPGDPGGLADALDELIADAELRRALGRRALANVRRYTWEACFERTLALLREIAIPA